MTGGNSSSLFLPFLHRRKRRKNRISSLPAAI